MPKASDEQIKRMLELKSCGLTYAQIADKLGWKNATADRSVARYIKKAEEENVEVNLSDKTLDEFTRQERYKVLKEKMLRSPRVEVVFEALSKKEISTFEEEYFSIIRSTDSLTEAEEQSLFSAVLSYVLAFRAIKYKHLEEELYQKSMDGKIKSNDAKYRSRIDDRHQKEYDSHMKKYEDTMKNLKMSRSQRLDKVKSERRTLVDVAQALSTKTAQADTALRIEQLELMKDEELKRLTKDGHLFGNFEG